MKRHGLSWMDDHLSRPMVDRIVAAIRSGGARGAALDFLRVPALPDDGHEADMLVQEWISDLIDGQDEETSRRALVQVAGLSCRIERTSLEMIRCTGMDAAVLIAIAYALSRDDRGGWQNTRLPEFIVTAGPARRDELQLSLEQDDRFAVSAPFASDTAWTHAGAIEIERPFPNAVCLAMHGRALKDVVDHPVLTPLELSITTAGMDMGGRTTTIATSFEPVWLTMSQLTYENTRPDMRTLRVEAPVRRRVPNEPTF